MKYHSDSVGRAAKKVIVVGGGFAGVAACKKLQNDPFCEVELIDRNNYHLFHGPTSVLVAALA